jgi:hypothetical protein
VTHAVVMHVSIDPASDREHRQSILKAFVVPEVRALMGFEQGIWMNDRAGTGTCVVVFDTERNARDAVATLSRQGGPPILTCDVHEIEVEVGS